MEITARNDGVWKDFVYCTDDRCLKIALHNSGDQKEHQFAAELTSSDTLFLFYAVKVETKPDTCTFLCGKSRNKTGHMYFLCGKSRNKTGHMYFFMR
jgi:hypothetical protein